MLIDFSQIPHIHTKHMKGIGYTLIVSKVLARIMLKQFDEIIDRIIFQIGCNLLKER
jgi:hypothetical protein